ncbi:MAG: lamin tail domain-containing protein [Bacteroidales bacterium]|nr:lamin tail domain-containing protein [Bacteroidales bacterium]
MKKLLIASVAALLALTACVKDNLYPYAAIDEVDATYAYNENTPVDVTITVSSFVDLVSVKLCYTKADDPEVAVDMTKGEGDTYTARIPNFDMGVVVKYHVEVETAAGITKSKEANYTVGVTPPNWKMVKLNELNGNKKFIEIINTWEDDVELEGMYIEKDGKKVWTAAKAHVLAPGARLLLYSEDVVGDGGEQAGYDATLVFTSGLSPKKAVRVQLFDPNGKSCDDFNLVNYSTPAPASYSRVPEGTGNWYYTAATPGAANPNDTSSAVGGLE